MLDSGPLIFVILNGLKHDFLLINDFGPVGT